MKYTIDWWNYIWAKWNAPIAICTSVYTVLNSLPLGNNHCLWLTEQGLPIWGTNLYKRQQISAIEKSAVVKESVTGIQLKQDINTLNTAKWLLVEFNMWSVINMKIHVRHSFTPDAISKSHVYYNILLDTTQSHVCTRCSPESINLFRGHKSINKN